MKRIAAPMVGGLLTSAFLTLEIIPVVVTYWRLEQLLWERLATVGAGLLRRLKLDATVVAVGAIAAAALAVASLYLTFPGRTLILGELWPGWCSSAASPPTSFTDRRPARWSGRPRPTPDRSRHHESSFSTTSRLPFASPCDGPSLRWRV